MCVYVRVPDLLKQAIDRLWDVMAVMGIEPGSPEKQPVL